MNLIHFSENAAAHYWLFLAWAVLLGALHGLEPGHSKGLMAAFIIGTRGTYFQAFLLALSATISHTAIVWLLAWPASYGGAMWFGTGSHSVPELDFRHRSPGPFVFDVPPVQSHPARPRARASP